MTLNVPTTTVALYWDTNPPAAADFHNLWIPTGATTLWQSGTPNGPGDRVHYPGYDGLVAGGVAPSPTVACRRCSTT